MRHYGRVWHIGHVVDVHARRERARHSVYAPLAVEAVDAQGFHYDCRMTGGFLAMQGLGFTMSRDFLHLKYALIVCYAE